MNRPPLCCRQEGLSFARNLVHKFINLWSSLEIDPASVHVHAKTFAGKLFNKRPCPFSRPNTSAIRKTREHHAKHTPQSFIYLSASLPFSPFPSYHRLIISCNKKATAAILSHTSYSADVTTAPHEITCHCCFCSSLLWVSGCSCLRRYVCGC